MQRSGWRTIESHTNDSFIFKPSLGMDGEYAANTHDGLQPQLRDTQAYQYHDRYHQRTETDEAALSIADDDHTNAPVVDVHQLALAFTHHV